MGPNRHRGDMALVGFSLLLKTESWGLSLEEARSSFALTSSTCDTAHLARGQWWPCVAI